MLKCAARTIVQYAEMHVQASCFTQRPTGCRTTKAKAAVQSGMFQGKLAVSRFGNLPNYLLTTLPCYLFLQRSYLYWLFNRRMFAGWKHCSHMQSHWQPKVVQRAGAGEGRGGSNGVRLAIAR